MQARSKPYFSQFAIKQLPTLSINQCQQ